MNSIRFICYLLSISSILISFSSNLHAQDLTLPAPGSRGGHFIENKGQWPDEVLYLTRMGGLDAWITRTGIYYDFYDIRQTDIPDKQDQYKQGNSQALPPAERLGHIVNQELLASNSSVQGSGIVEQTTYYNYFIGNDPSAWASEVKQYDEVILENVYEGIDQRLYRDSGGLRYDYILHPGSEYEQIQFRLSGADSIQVNPDGDLTFMTRFGEVTHRDLQVYQVQAGKRILIPANWKIEGDIIRYELAAYDESQDLVIDPLIYATFLGGPGIERANSLAIDENENAYITGTDQNNGSFPTTTGAYDETFNGSFDVFVSRINSAGTSLLFSTYLGGSQDDQGLSITLDTAGNVWLTGDTRSSDFPTTSMGYDPTFNGAVDVFATKLSNDGTQLLLSTFLGGSDIERGNAIVLDDTGNVYLTGSVTSFDFPTTADAFDRTINSGGNFSDIFVAKLDSSGTALSFSTYIGGSVFENAVSIALDLQNNVYLTGVTASLDFPTTTGVIQETLNSGGPIPDLPDAYVTQLSSSGSQLIYSTYIGGTEWETGWSIAVDTSGNAFVAGATESSNFPTTTGAFQEIKSSSFDMIAFKLNSDATALMYATYLGGSGSEIESRIKIDAYGYAYIGGTTTSNNLPSTPDAIDLTYNGEEDVFIGRLPPSGASLDYLTYLGGGDSEYLGDFAIRNNGDIWLAGRTASPDFPITAGGIQTVIGTSGSDAFVSKLQIPPVPVSIDSDRVAFPLSLYPNPSSGQLTIEFPANSGVVQVDLFDSMGRWVLGKQNIRSKDRIETDLPDGLYVIHITKGKEIFSRKIWIQP